MAIASIRPSTVDGIQKLAKQICRSTYCTHTEALELASRQAGLQNFVHAKRQLAAGVASQKHQLFLSTHWTITGDRGQQIRFDEIRAGSEMPQLETTMPLLDILEHITKARHPCAVNGSAALLTATIIDVTLEPCRLTSERNPQ